MSVALPPIHPAISRSHYLIPSDRCGGARLDPEADAPCTRCHGQGAFINLPWKKHAPPQPPATLTPAQVRSLRSLGCKVAEYPAEGTAEWAAFEARDAERRARVRERLNGVRERLGLAHAKARRRIRRARG